MPRSARKKGESGIYHITMRGINRQQIFIDDEDAERFLQVVRATQTISGFTLYAYCLMGNHVHLVLKEGDEPLEKIMKRIGVRYVYWYNWKYMRSGHLFQDRFGSEPVDDDGYFLTVIKYVHRNPVKAGVCERCEDYAFSSAREYLGMCKSSLVQTELFGGIMEGNDIRAFFNTPSDEKCIDVSETHRMNDTEARAVMKRICRCDQPGAFQKLPIDKQAKAIERMREQLSIRQISRITGVSTEIVRKYKVKET